MIKKQVNDILALERSSFLTRTRTWSYERWLIHSFIDSIHCGRQASLSVIRYEWKSPCRVNLKPRNANCFPIWLFSYGELNKVVADQELHFSKKIFTVRTHTTTLPSADTPQPQRAINIRELVQRWALEEIHVQQAPNDNIKVRLLCGNTVPLGAGNFILSRYNDAATIAFCF